jgi:hypothetical protein
MIKKACDRLNGGCIAPIRLLLVNSIMWEQLHETRRVIQKRLRVLDEEIPETDDEKVKFNTALFKRYKRSLEERLEFHDVTQSITKGESHKLLVEGVLKHFLYKCDQVAEEIFGRFPLIVEAIQRVSRTVLHTVTRPALEELSLYLIQTHFVLLHAFECDEGNCTRNCTFFTLVSALCSALVEDTQSFVIAQVQDQLDKFVFFIREPPPITEERIKLKEKLKVMQNAFALLP